MAQIASLRIDVEESLGPKCQAVKGLSYTAKVSTEIQIARSVNTNTHIAQSQCICNINYLYSSIVLSRQAHKRSDGILASSGDQRCQMDAL